MTKRWARQLLTLLALCVWTLDVQAQDSERRAPTFAVVVDGPSDTFRQATRQLGDELVALLGERFEGFDPPRTPTHVGEFTEASARVQVERALSDPEVDAVIGFGVQTGRVLGHIERLPKPVFLPFAHAELQDLPRSGAGSGRHNLNYLTGLVDLERALRRFREVIRRERVVIVVDSHILEGVDDLEGHARRWAHDEMQIRMVAAGATVESVVDALPPDAEAVYIGPLVQLPDSEVDALLSALSDRGLPTYASEGRAWVERGAFVSLVPADEDKRRLRKVALNLDEALDGEDPANMDTTFERHARLTINMRTARKLRIWPRFELMTDAELIGEGQGDRGESFTLRRAVEEALRANLDLSAQRENIEIAKQQYRIARGEMAPKINGEAGFTWIPKQTVFPLFNSERTLDVGANATQLIYSPAVMGGLRSQRYAVRASEQGVKTSKMDVILQAADAYLNLLRAKTAENITRDFLGRVRQNLSMAEVRVEIGASGRQEVFRWETEIADARVNVLDAAATRNKAAIELNRVLNRPLEEPLQTLEPLNEPGGILVDERIRELVDDPWSFRLFREFMAEEAVRRSPEVAELDAQIRTQEEVLKARRSQLFLPDIFLNGGVSRVLHRSGRGKETPPTDPDSPTRRLDFTWEVGASAQMTLYDQPRYAELDQTRAQLMQLRAQRAAVAQAVEQRVRSETHDAGVTSAAMQLRKDAAEAAERNLELVTDAYRKGTVDIITLIDAQNQALSSDLRAANAVYDFLIDFVEVERAAGRFGFMQDEENRREFVHRLTRFYQKRRAASAQGDAP